jgi:cytochrome c-550 PedF
MKPRIKVKVINPGMLQSVDIVISGFQISPLGAMLVMMQGRPARQFKSIALPALLFWLIPLHVFSHGDVQPQAVDTTGLTALGDEWLAENPYREDAGQKPVAIEIGASAYNQNCARCHGLEAISGGIAPDLRLLKEGALDDEWFMERIRNGYHQNGITKMPGFESLMSQEAMWAIRTYIESRPLPE